MNTLDDVVCNFPGPCQVGKTAQIFLRLNHYQLTVFDQAFDDVLAKGVAEFWFYVGCGEAGGFGPIRSCCGIDVGD